MSRNRSTRVREKTGTLRLLLLLFAGWLLFPGLAHASGFEAPVGVTDLLAGDQQRTRVALVEFSSPRLASERGKGILGYLEHNLMFRPGYEGKYTVSGYDEVAPLIRRELPGTRLDPLSLSVIKPLISKDFLVFGDERLQGRNWVWRLRVFNGRSGAFVSSVEAPLYEAHLSWTLGELLAGLHAILQNQTPSPAARVAPRDTILGRSLDLLPKLKEECLAGRCLARLDSFEWIQQHDPDVFTSLMRNPLFLNALHKEATTPQDFARIGMLQGNHMDVALRMEALLSETRQRNLRIAYLTLLGQASVHLGRPENAFQAFDELHNVDRANADALWGLAWVHQQRNRCEQALELLEPLQRRFPDRVDVLELLISCHLHMKRQDRAWPYKAALARALSAQGQHMAANSLYMELLDNDFQWGWMGALVIPLLPPLELKSLATMLNQHGVANRKEEVDLFLAMAQVKKAEGNQAEAGRVLQGLIQLAPDNPIVLEHAVWHELEHGRDLTRAREWFAAIPARQRNPLQEGLLWEASKNPTEALSAWERGRFPASWRLEVLLHQANSHVALGNHARALALLDQALAIDRGREEIHEQLREIHGATGSPDKASQAEAALMQLRGRAYDSARYESHLLGTDYGGLILPHPLVSVGQGGRVEGMGKVLVLSGNPLNPKPDWKERLRPLFPYLPRVPDQVAEEIRLALSERYEVVENRQAELAFRERLHPRHDQSQTRYSKSELMQLGNTLGADSLFVVRTEELPQLSRNNLDIRVDLYFYDSVANAVYRTSVARSLPYFAVYRFNTVLIAIPLALLVLLVLALARFHRTTRHLQNPLLHAGYLIRQKNYRRAADVLEKNGYIRDSLAMRGHQFFRQQDYVRALDAFYHAKDMENAELCLPLCPDSEEVNTLAADLFFQQRQYDRAEHYYRKTRNLLGMAKIYEARGKQKKAARVRGQYYFERNNPVAAIEEYRRVGDFDRAGFVFFYHGKYKEAAAMFRQGNNEEMYRKSMLRMGKRPAEAGV